MQWALPTTVALYPYLAAATRVLVILALALILSRIVRRAHLLLRDHFLSAMKQHAGGSIVELEKRATTVGGIIRKTATVLIWSIAVTMSLREVGLDIRPILAGAGVVGLAVGFGAQNLVRDVLSGMFLLIENQVRVNDVAVINGTGGLVEEINLRTTVLRGMDGAVHIFPNGSITTLSNLTREFSYYVFDIRVTYVEDTDRAVEVMREAAAEIQDEEPYRSAILEPLEILGVDQFTDSGVLVKARIKTMPIRQWMVGREVNRRLKKRFEAAGISFGAPRLSISLPLNDAGARAALRDTIREVIREELAARDSATPPSR